MTGRGKALVTGAGGFIGSHLVEALLKEGWQVRALVHYRSQNQWGHLAEVHQEVTGDLEIVPGDVTDPYLVQRAVQGCDSVFHLAALIGIPYSYHAPSSYVVTNVMGGLNVLEACRRESVRRVIMTSTSEVYGTAQFVPMTEEHPLHAQSPYAASKVGADQMARAYHLSFSLPVVILRPFNTYGPRQSLRAIIPSILLQLLAEEPTLKLGNLSSKRDFTFVEDTAWAFILAAAASAIEGETIHFGSGASVNAKDLAERCMKVTGRQAAITTVKDRQRPESSEVGDLVCDASKAKRLLGWHPRTSLEEGLARTVEYLRRRRGENSTESYYSL